MNGNIAKGPKGFVTYAKFFEKMTNVGGPVRLDDQQKALFTARLEALDPRVVPHYGVSEDWLDSACIREAVMLRDGRIYVRYEVSCRRCDGGWDGPYQLLVLWNSDASVDAYTFIHESGRGNNVAASMYTASCDRSEYTQNLNEALGFAMSMDDGDAIIVGNDDCDGEFLCVTSQNGAAHLAWQVFGSPYYFNSTAAVTWPEAVNAVRVFEKEGVRGAQQLCEWEIADAYDENSKRVTVPVPLILRRDLSRALREGNKERAEEIRGCGIDLDGELPDFEVACKFGTEEEILRRLASRAKTCGDSLAAKRLLQLVENRRKG